MLRLYHGPTSVCSQKVRLTLAEIGLGYESELLDLQKGEQYDPAYMRLNPEGVVPTLIDGDLVLVESSLIAEYLDKVYNGGGLMPVNVALEFRVRHWLLRCLSVHEAINTLSFSTFMRDKIRDKSHEEIEQIIARIPDPVNRAKRRDLYANGLESIYVKQALRHIHRVFKDASTHIGDGTWISGPAFGLADIGLAPYIDRIDRLGFSELWAKEFPTVGQWLETIKQRPSYAPAIEAFVPEPVANSQRASGARHWTELSRLWQETLNA